MNRPTSAFTLIELLIVVAIIAVLAAIAVPNFLEAQVRAKVSASKADIRSLVTAIESYKVDTNAYPYYPDPAFRSSGFMNSNNPETLLLWRGYTPFSLTTPVSYMTSLPKDAFVSAKGAFSESHPYYLNTLQLYQFDHHRTPRFSPSSDPHYWDNRTPAGVNYVVIGVGPDLITPVSTIIDAFHNNAHEYLQLRNGGATWAGDGRFYDPSNGTISPGDIVYHGPGMGFEPTNFVDATRYY